MIATASNRMLNGQHQLLSGDKVVGRAWRWPARFEGKRPVGFGLVIDGWYWSKGEANQRGGSSSTGVKTLRDALALTDKVLGAQGGQK